MMKSFHLFYGEDDFKIGVEIRYGERKRCSPALARYGAFGMEEEMQSKGKV